MHSDNPEFFHTLLSSDFYEGLSGYKPTTEFSDIVREISGELWSIQPRGFWTQCDPPNVQRLTQGWKIHISAVPSTGAETLRRVAGVFVAEGVNFKFCSDRFMLRCSVNKNWPREQAGKYITAYPNDEAQFVRVMEACHQATRDLRGPYVLSDRPYKDSKVVFYRYGEHAGVETVDELGRRVSYILTPGGARVPELRTPYYRQPDWVSDPVSTEGLPVAPTDDGIVLGGKYRVYQALKYSSIGGVYRAVELTTGRSVIIHEARPMTQRADDGFDGQRALEKQARVLQRLAHTGYAPDYIDFFEEATHLFLVQERLDAESLWGHAMNLTFADGETPQSVFESLRRTAHQIADGLAAVHGAGVVLRDLTRNNVMFTIEGHHCKFVDFEFAFETDRDDPPVMGWTVGYASREQLMTLRPTPLEDYYAFGALILDMVAYTAPGYSLNRKGVLRSFRQTLRDQQMPAEFHSAVKGLTEEDPSRRWNPARALAALDRAELPAADRFLFAGFDETQHRDLPTPRARRLVERVLQGLVRFIVDSTTFDRHDRLWPPSGDAFQTNALQIQFGACGTIAFLHRVRHPLADAATDWVLEHLRTRKCPAGLYSGLAGVALVLLELGRIDHAKALLETSAANPEMVHQAPNLYYGTAGCGLANLCFWQRLGDQRYLDRAQEYADHLARTARVTSDGADWAHDGAVHLGLGHGQSGIAAFLLYLNAVSRDDRVLDLAVKALDFEIANRFEVRWSVLWFPIVGATPGAPKSPHMRHGSAGVGSALIRGYAATGLERFLQIATRCAHATKNRFTNKLWYDYGLAGYGEFLLDMYRFTGDVGYVGDAFHIARGIIQHRIPRGTGFAFAGSSMLRISCDFGMGSSGIGVFLHRLLDPTQSRFMFPDELLPSRAVRQEWAMDRNDALEHSGRASADLQHELLAI